MTLLITIHVAICLQLDGAADRQRRKAGKISENLRGAYTCPNVDVLTEVIF